MKNQFVTYEIAKKLKELNFQDLVAAYFAPSNTGNEQELWPSLDPDFLVEHQGGMQNKVSSELTAAPLWQQAIDWLWEKGYFVCVFPLTKTSFGYSIDFKRSHPDKYNEKDYAGVTNTVQILNQIVEEEKLKGWENLDPKKQSEFNFTKPEATEAAILKALELIKTTK